MKHIFITLILILYPSLVLSQIVGFTVTTESKTAEEEFRKGWERYVNWNNDEARTHFKKAAEEDANFALAYLGLALTSKTDENEKKYFKKARELNKAISDQEKELIDIYYYMYNNADVNEALNTVERVIKKYPQVWNFWSIRAGIKWTQRKYDEAISDYQKVLQINPEYASVYTDLGYLYREKGDYQAAKEYLMKYSQIMPDDPVAFDNLGDLYQTLGEYDNALSNYRSALKIKPDYEYSTHNIVNLLASTGKYEKAIEENNKFLNGVTDPADKMRFYNNLSGIYISLGQIGKAIEVRHQAEKINPDASENAHSRQLNWRGYVWLKAKEYDKARALFEAAKQEATEWSKLRPLFNLVKLEAEVGDYERALSRLTELEKQLEKMGMSERWIRSLEYLRGKIAFEKGEFPLAIEKFKKAKELSKSFPLSYSTDLAEAYLKNGQPDLASTALKLWLERNPKHPKALLIMADINLARKSPEGAKKNLEIVKDVFAEADADFPLVKELNEKLATMESIAVE